MTEQTEWEKLREKIEGLVKPLAHFYAVTFASKVMEISEIEERLSSDKTDQILADFKASFPELAKQEGYVKLADDQTCPYKVIKSDCPEGCQLEERERMLKAGFRKVILLESGEK